MLIGMLSRKRDSNVLPCCDLPDQFSGILSGCGIHASKGVKDKLHRVQQEPVLVWRTSSVMQNVGEFQFSLERGKPGENLRSEKLS